MTLLFNLVRKRFETISTYAEKDLSKNAGFRWDQVARVWHSNNPANAAILKAYADTFTQAFIESEIERGGAEAARLAREVQEKAEKTAEAKQFKADHAAEILAASHATDSTISIPAPTGLDYLPYQKAGIAYALSRTSTLIADEMGLGKTIQALGIINADASINRTLIIVPAGLRLNWVKEAQKWLVRPTHVVRPDKKSLPILGDSSVLILGYEEARKYALELQTIAWDLIVADEAHYLKNHAAKRTVAIMALKATRWVLLTGTPVLNRPIELFTLLKKIDPDDLGKNWMAYILRYCNAFKNKWGWQTDGSSNLEELNEKLRLGGMIRRLKSQVLLALPDKRRSLIPVEPNSAARKLIEEEKQKALERLKNIRKAKALEGKNPEAFADDIKKLRGAGEIMFTEMSRIRHELALLKVEQVVEYVSDALVSEPVIVFAHHTDVCRKIATALKDISKPGTRDKFKVATLTGEDPAEVRQAAVEAFQAGELDCLVCSIKAAGVGLTMTRSSHVIFAELDWTPGWMLQAEDRAHRIGQKNAVNVEWLVLDGSLEAKMAKTLMAKLKVVTTATGDNVTPDVAAPVETIPVVVEEDPALRARYMQMLAVAEDFADLFQEAA